MLKLAEKTTFDFLSSSCLLTHLKSAAIIQTIIEGKCLGFLILLLSPLFPRDGIAGRDVLTESSWD